MRIGITPKRMIFAVTISDKRVIKTMNRLMHPSAWNMNSPKFVCKMLCRICSNAPETKLEGVID